MAARIRLALISGATFLVSLTLEAPHARALDDPNGVLSKTEQKCVVTINKNVAAVAKAQGKINCGCIKDGAKGKLVGQTIEQCLTADNKGKVGKARTKLGGKVSSDCTGPAPRFGVDPNGIDSDALSAKAIERELSLIHGIFGTDLDTSIVSEKPTSKCQQDVAKQAKKCFDTKWKVFNKCKKDGLKGNLPAGQLDSARDLERHCLQSDPNDPTTSQPDASGKIAKACDTKLLDKLSSKCGGGVNLAAAFPGSDPNSGFSGLRDFVDATVECEFCKLVNATDGLRRDCDLFDDGLPNGSCDCPECTLDYTSDTRWLCKPGMAVNQCFVNSLDATEVLPDNTTALEVYTGSEDHPYDCFYIYPTVDLSTSFGNHTDFTNINPELGALLSQAARLNDSCRIFAPLYRQITFGTFASPDLAKFLDLAYKDVKAAWDHYLDEHNGGRDFVIMGHSQGTFMTTRLLQEEVDLSPALREQLIVALLIGGSVTVPQGETVGGSFANIPLCTSNAETGCVIAYRTYAEGFPPEAGSNAPSDPNTFDTACTNLVALGGGAGVFQGTYLSAVFTPPGFGTPFTKYKDFYAGECVKDDRNASYLEIRVAPADPNDARENQVAFDSPVFAPSFLGTHILDFHFAMGDLIELVETKAAAMP